ncbi:hypothetical protein D3C71_1760380 [compost metagenome]
MMAPATVMKAALSVNSSTLTRVVLMPTCTATVSSSPITRSASPSRVRAIQARRPSTSASSTSSCQ